MELETAKAIAMIMFMIIVLVISLLTILTEAVKKLFGVGTVVDDKKNKIS